ncbi:MAG: universal stress protein [Thermomicrobiales bacterium]
MATVLAPIDGSDLALRALPWAAELAGPRGRIILLRAVDATGDTRAESAANAELDRAAAALGTSGVDVDRLIVAGDPAEEIAKAGADRGVEAIVIASHGRGAVGRALFGSVADRVSRVSRVPVVILRVADQEGVKPEVRRIVTPLDGSDLAMRAIPIAISLARQFNAPIHVVRAIDSSALLPVAPGVFGASPVISAEVADQIWAEAEADAKSTVNEATSQMEKAGVTATGAILNGSPFFAISDVLEPGDLIVLTSHGRGGVRRWLLGSVAEKLVREAPAPVMLVPAPERADLL